MDAAVVGGVVVDKGIVSSKGSEEMATELLFDLQVLSLQHADALLLIPFVNLLIHGFILDDLLRDVEGFASALFVEHGGTVCGLEASI